MIRYTLKCSDGHAFDSWFKSANAFDALLRDNHLSCPQCGTHDVHKSLMAPTIKTSGRSEPAPDTDHAVAPENAAPFNSAQPSVPSTKAAHTPAQPETPQDLSQEIEKLRQHVESSSDYVGDNFAKEARKMSEGEIPERAIYGEAKLEEAKALIDDGIPVLPLPFAPRRKLN